jgi:glycosyltransferase involved in cell wall biosynthesis
LTNNRYILITAARNEQSLIEDTIQSVLSQTIKPVEWYIVSDNSTDSTDDIIKEYAKSNGFIKFLRTNDSSKRDFASKVYAINLALTQINKNNYDFIGILDADITFNPDYYESMLREFDNNLKLGIAGGEFYDLMNGKKFKVLKSPGSVRGGIQLFRKNCFEDIGGFVPLKNGGEDIITEVTARMNGWNVRSFDHQILEHHRLTGTGGWGILEAKFREGGLAYAMGYHPLFQFVKSIYRLKERPFIVSGILHFIGFIWANIKREKRAVSKDFIAYLRTEQLARMKSFKR